MPNYLESKHSKIYKIYWGLMTGRYRVYSCPHWHEQLCGWSVIGTRKRKKTFDACVGRIATRASYIPGNILVFQVEFFWFMTPRSIAVSGVRATSISGLWHRVELW